MAVDGPLPRGAYTVTWLTVSETDGHRTAGTFSFGVGVAPPAGGGDTGGIAQVPRPGPFSVTAKTLLYAGLSLLLGAACVGLVLLRTIPALSQELDHVVNVFDPWARDRGSYYSLEWKARPDAAGDSAFAPGQ